MKKVILLLAFMPVMAYSQVFENFESGLSNSWVQSNSGRWNADTISSISGNYSLHHVFDNPEAGNDRIGIRLTDFHPSQGISRWSFIVQHGYDPSSSNNWAVFLMSDVSPDLISLSGGTNGFAIGVNITGSDDSLRLVKVKSGVITTVVNCRVNWQMNFGISKPVKIIVERSATGDWNVKVLNLSNEITGTSNGRDSELFAPDWLGVCYRYSSTRDRLLWIDDFKVEGVFYKDTKAPSITSCIYSGSNSIDLKFDEPPSEVTMTPLNFSLNSGEIHPVSVVRKTPLYYSLIFNGQLVNKKSNQIIAGRICDDYGNCSENIQLSFIPVWPETGDVLITEIMADPVPAVSLPEEEYLEITNRSDFTFNLKNWRLVSPGQISLLPQAIINPGEILIICSAADTLIFRGMGKVIGLKLFPLLTDDGKLICIEDSTAHLIHGTEYSSVWYGDQLKKEGGWSMEMIDTDFPFYDRGNWSASVNRKGGTPGRINSVIRNNPDDQFGGLKNVFPEDSVTLKVSFSEPVINFVDHKNRISIEGLTITYLIENDPLYRKFSLKLNEKLIIGKSYKIEMPDDLKDFSGNMADRREFLFGLPSEAQKGDVLFNELLFNPLPGNPDYIELYNSSDKVIDASRLKMISINDEMNDTSQVYPVSLEQRCLMPGAYYALTTDRQKVEQTFQAVNSECLFEMYSIPSMSDDKGHLVLYNRELDKIDEVSYNEKMHYSLLSGYEGISIEKISPQLVSDLSVNWHSAAASSGWGTPGAVNSLYVESPASTDRVTLSSTKITPDNDGYEDFLLINFNLKGNGNIISAIIFDESGNYVKKLGSNILAGPDATLLWDGTSDDGSPVQTGIYIVFITWYDDAGKTGKIKKACAVIR